MSQHSLRFPACQSCRHQVGGAIIPTRCAGCQDAAEHEPRLLPITRDQIDTTVLAAIARYIPGQAVTLDAPLQDMGVRSVHKVQVELDLEDEYEAHQMHLPPRLAWDTPRQLADHVALQLLPGESGEIIDHAAWAEDTLAACAEARRPQAARDVPPGTLWAFTEFRTMDEVMVAEQQAAACTDGIPRPEVVREPWPPVDEGILAPKTGQEG
ncbi:hypothetical protein H261_11934 [Paramagnetospirillum caucaseum]|uniref:Uncharacterized protein n=1 Tax=Paramagnetospirillum caucaseum TaxID=1244869 RepID=M3AAE9_9PROT|nr:acyl carrier protein [Paramagnetospirillum caucaseum]EME69743.1 hypothetical protein H261_11934 [Paramagnetospirillum caucaseum]